MLEVESFKDMTSIHTYEPPKFIDDASGYPEYRRKLERWSRITKVAKQQQAEVVLYHLEGHPSRIQDKIDTALGDKIIDKEDGMKELIAYLDTIYAEDDMVSAWINYKKFVKLKKIDTQPISEFISEFEKHYIKAKESGCDFSDNVLAFNLLESCCLSDTDEKFVLTAIDFKNGKEKKDLFDQVKSSLRKFQSRDRLCADDCSGGTKLKVEQEAYLIDTIKETLLTEGWTPPNKSSNSQRYKGRKNPIGNDGKPLRCFNCQSEFHFADRCDQKRQQRDSSKNKKETKSKTLESVTMLSTLFNKSEDTEFAMISHVQTDDQLIFVTDKETELCCLIEEAGCRGVLDSACSKSVAGLNWIQKYTQHLAPSISNSLSLTSSDKVFQFGGGEKRKSYGCLKLPTMIGDKLIYISIDIVDAEIPLLIGSNSMEAAGTVLDFKSHSAMFFDEEVEMIKIGSGHYCIDLMCTNLDTHIPNILQRDEHIQNILITSENLKPDELKKLHHVFGHTSVQKLISFLKKAGKYRDDMQEGLKDIERTCKSCIRSKRLTPRPKSAMPRVDRPNEIVSIDLKEWSRNSDKRYICYLIDMHSRLTVARFIPDKKPESVVKCIIENWIPTFGVMNGIHSDIGGETCNQMLEDVAAILGIKLTTTASYSPHQNGLNERNHAVVDLMIIRMLDADKDLSPEVALCWALNAKNSLDNCEGFSPFQLHVGKNPVLPSVVRDGPPCYNDTTKSKSLAMHLHAMHLAREEFIQAESSKVLKKALKSRVYARGDGIMEGDWIYFKKNDTKNHIWSGPSKVVATNGKKLFVDQGARLGTVNRDNAIKVGEEFWKRDGPDASVQTIDDGKEGLPMILLDSNSPVTDTAQSSELEHDDIATEQPTVDEHENDVHSDENGSDSLSDQVEACWKEVSCHEVKKNDIIRYHNPETNGVESSIVVSRGGKSTGSNKYWWNVNVQKSGEIKSINTEKVGKLERLLEAPEDVTGTLVVTIPRYLYNEPECVAAKENELENWDKFQTYVEVDDIGQERLLTNWVLVRKSDGVKARLCIRGDQEEGKEDIRTDSPTAHKTNIKLFYIVAAHFGWNIGTADVKAAFLQGAKLDREVYVLPPKERRKPGKVWKMIKRAYGFVDASRGFYLELDKALLSLGCKASMHDPALYTFCNNDGKLQGVILTHVDDLLHGSGSAYFFQNVMLPLKQIFTFGKETQKELFYVGMHVVQEKDSIVVDQDQYVQSLEVPELYDCKNETGLDSMLSDVDQTEYRAILGKIGWIAHTSRPDLSYDCLLLSTKTGRASMRDMKQAIKLMKKLKSGSTKMCFPDLGPIEEWTLVGYGDAGFKSLPDKVSSCGGHVEMISNEKRGISCITSWRSKKLKRVVSSSTAAEALAANETLDGLIYIKSVLRDLLGLTVDKIPVVVYTDSRNLHKSVYSSKLVEDARVRTDVGKLQESIKSGEMKDFIFVEGKQMIADCLTKKGVPGFCLMEILQKGKL